METANNNNNNQVPAEPRQHHNPTWVDATRISPFMQYVECVNDKNRPADHVGDWPVAGTVYPALILESKTMGGIPVVHILGFTGEKPYYNTFHPDRFLPVVNVCLN